MFAFMMTGNYHFEKSAATEAPKLSKNQKKKLRQRIKNKTAVGNVAAEAVEQCEGGNSSADTTTKTLFHIDVYAIAGKFFGL